MSVSLAGTGIQQGGEADVALHSFGVRSVRAMLAAACFLVAAPTAWVVAASPIDIGAARLYYNMDTNISRPSGYDWENADPGSWHLAHAGFRDGKLTLHLLIKPGPTTLPLDPGPAAIFGTLSLGGESHSDVGGPSEQGPVESAAVRPCADTSACVYRARITLPTAGCDGCRPASQRHHLGHGARRSHLRAHLRARLVAAGPAAGACQPA